MKTPSCHITVSENTFKGAARCKYTILTPAPFSIIKHLRTALSWAEIVLNGTNANNSALWRGYKTERKGGGREGNVIGEDRLRDGIG